MLCSYASLSFWLPKMQNLQSIHPLQLGFLAVQHFRPCQISQWWACDHLFWGMFFISSFSTSRTVFPFARPIRRDTRKTCVSTAIAGILKALLITTLAVLRPTPGSVINSASCSGTLPWYSVNNWWQVSMIFLAFVLASPQVFILSSRPASPNDKISSGVLWFLNKSPVTIFTLTSVHCAERMVAISNSKGLLKSKPHCSCPYRLSSVAQICSIFFFVTNFRWESVP